MNKWVWRTGGVIMTVVKRRTLSTTYLHIDWTGSEPGSPWWEGGEEQHEALHGLWRKEKWDWRRRISGVGSTQFRMSGILLPWRPIKNRFCWCFIMCMNGRIIRLNANPRRFSSERFGWQAREGVIEFKLPRKLSPNLLTHSSASSWIFMNLSVNSVPLETTLSSALFTFQCKRYPNNGVANLRFGSGTIPT